MVGALLLKMLHCKLKCQNKKLHLYRTEETMDIPGSSCDDIGKDSAISSNDVAQKICRVCLKEGEIPIYDNKGTGDISEELNLFGGLDVQADDDYPKYICQTCHALLLGAILFRKTAQQSDQLLKRPTQESMLLTDNDDLTNDIGEDNACEYEEEKCKETKNYHCKRCDLDFQSFNEYSEHRLSQEHENMRHTCPICKNTYTALYFKKHLALHKLENTYMCDICGKIFIVQGQFTRHRLTHFYSLPFKCSLCPYKGRFSESLKMHMRTHTGEKPYQCTQCPSRFVNKSNLNKHMLTHKGVHDFKCNLCGRGFYTKRNLDLHFKVDHTGIKDHVCNVCGKAFGYRKQMMKHQLKVHKREKLRSGRMPLYLQVETKQKHGEEILTES
ncbi:gastrula zinc finger protein XlCGF17.1-like [Galleria mellonella]|uniref:Gastrula zinc finger protein XlCGF17.1-like n=1 Tax=Galleria mellonella TaxID=7137 RepID=A0A6J1WQS1_GALME|nr:gastrula zinc finger protein XlCGF17.1-like [Galleria mellonella]